MVENPRRPIPVMAVAVMLLLTVFTGISAADHDPSDSDHASSIPDTYFDGNTDLAQPYEVANEEGVTTVKKAFLKAKKAFHEARQEIQAIEKGDESSVEDVPSIFDGEDDGDDDSSGDDSSDDENWQDGSDPEFST